MNPCHHIVRGGEESVSAIYEDLDAEEKDEEAWFILDMWAISGFLAFPEYNETHTSRTGANIKQKWPSSLWKPHSHHVVQTPTRRSERSPAGRSTAVTASVHHGGEQSHTEHCHQLVTVETWSGVSFSSPPHPNPPPPLHGLNQGRVYYFSLIREEWHSEGPEFSPTTNYEKVAKTKPKWLINYHLIAVIEDSIIDRHLAQASLWRIYMQYRRIPAEWCFSP